MDERVNCFAMLSTSPCVILKTETTGIDTTAEVLELSVIDLHGQILLNTLVRPSTSISSVASRVHGITNEHVANSPTLTDVWPQLLDIIRDKIVVVYNAEYHIRMLIQSCNARGIVIPERFNAKGFFCARSEYQTFAKPAQRPSLAAACVFEKIPVAHRKRALDDCFMTLFLIQTVLRKIHKMKMQVQ